MSSWSIASATDDYEAFSVPSEDNNSSQIKNMANQLLTNVMSNSKLSTDKDLFLDAMKEVTDSIIGRADSLPPNPFLSTSSDLPTPPNTSGQSASSKSNLVISTHSASLASVSTLPSSSSNPPRIPVHHLSPLSRQKGPKGKSEQLNEFARLRKEKLEAVERAKEEEKRRRIQTVDRPPRPKAQVKAREAFGKDDDDGNSSSSSGSEDEDEDEDEEDGFSSPAPSYETGGAGNGGAEDALSGEQLAALRKVFQKVGDLDGNLAGFADAGLLTAALHSDVAAHGAFGAEIVRFTCDALKIQRGKVVAWDEFVGLVVAPNAKDGGPGAGSFQKSMVRHTDPTVSLDFSSMGLSALEIK
ncbi:hypothetical protein TeGR_g9505 [Tetraparma gracilis]|uniref:Uncharacterized protein n=1 Tax=Tetraparma gracilis TaxID=2962635 RepID=A0ABQ6N2X0_9STRA|nr:hypothetical protein TeGR_g9505 [Tetraparma gracilis]